MRLRDISQFHTDQRLPLLVTLPVGRVGEDPDVILAWWVPSATDPFVAATRYALTLVVSAERYMILAWTNAPDHGRSMLVPQQRLDRSYIATRLGPCSEADLDAIVRFLELILDPEA